MPSSSNAVYFDPDKHVCISKTLLCSTLRQILSDKFGIHFLYEMQQKSLHHLLARKSRGVTTNDMILCAPTGSGKTLAYALPIVQSLTSRITPLVRAVIIVPTRDLAQQVFKVFHMLCKPLKIAVAMVTGASSLSREATMLRQPCEILVATPGRLVYHTKHTKGFNLEHVRFLVLDESDRLLHESYDRWIPSLMPYIGHCPSAHASTSHSITKNSVHTADKQLNNGYRPRTGLFALAIVPSVAIAAGSDFKTVSDVRVRKILVSATQTQTPTHLVHLDMRRPTILRVNPSKNASQGPIEASEQTSDDHYTVPSTLRETAFIVKSIQEKPAALLYLLGWTAASADKFNSKGAKLVFTNSIDSAHRLCRLLEICAYALGIYENHFILEMSGELSAERRREVVAILHKASDTSTEANQKKTPIIVCSDVLSRGLDVFNIDRVINYDTPVFLHTYLHRGGRTARAGKHGEVSTLLLAKQAHHFRRMVHEVDRGEKVVQTFNLRKIDILSKEIEGILTQALFGLKRVLGREKLNLLSRESSLPSYTLFELDTRDKSELNEGIQSDYSHGIRVLDSTQGDGLGSDNGFSPGIDFQTNQFERKRKRDDLEHDDEAAMGDPDLVEEEYKNDEGNDDLRHLLYAQIAKNLMT